MELPQLASVMLPAIEAEMQRVIAIVHEPAQPVDPGIVERTAGLYAPVFQMLAHHMGWENDNASAGGKRIRPVILLLSNAAAGGRWESALPAAASVELLHNFSLIHDDIEDNSPLRRGRPTVWSRWGIPQAINTGDMLFTLSHLALLRLNQNHDSGVVLQAAQRLHETCLALTQGQYLDIAFEGQRTLPLESYWPMIHGKTAALLACCTELGALLADASPAIRQAYYRFGLYLGLAFQVQDDLLGIWGDAFITGKSSASDLLSGKKSLPVLYGLQQRGRFAERWLAGPLLPGEVAEMAELLRGSGAYDYAQEIANSLTSEALKSLDRANPIGEAGTALRFLAAFLVDRKL